MTESYPKLSKPPIVEAIVDFDCDVPPSVELKSLEQSAREVFRERYPDAQARYLQEVRVATGQDGAFNSSLQRSLQAWMFKVPDGKQLVQVRQSGFSFNQLAPYGGFDACLPRIKEAWSQYLDLVKPIVVREVRVRYINRILLPIDDTGQQGLNHFLNVDAAPPADTRLVQSGFLTQYQATDPETGFHAAVVLASQPSESGKLPVVFDNGVSANNGWEPSDWDTLASVLESLRDLKNRIFFQTVKQPCLELFR